MNSLPKIYFKLLLIILGIFSLLSLSGNIFRNSLLDPNKPFPSWTYDSVHKLVNVWTSWDSGFYYEVSDSGYPLIKSNIPTYDVAVEGDTWIKVFLGSGMVGKNRYSLPLNVDDEHNNVIVLLGEEGENSNQISVYNIAEGVPYCKYKGDIDYTRDIESLKEGFFNNQSCGESACKSTYISYFDTTTQNLVFQEKLSLVSGDTIDDAIIKNEVLVGDARPVGFDDEFIGEGCESIAGANIYDSNNIDYKEQFTSYSVMPLYPYLINFVSSIGLDVVIVGIFISILFYILSVIYFYRLCNELFQDSGISVWATVSYIFFPLAFYNYAFLPISLFNFLLYFSIYYFITNKTWAYAVSTFLLPFVYWWGISLSVVFALQSLKNKKFLVSLINLLVPFVSLAILVSYIYTFTSDYFALITTRIPWYSGGETFVGGLVAYFLELNVYKLASIGMVAILLVLNFLGSIKTIDLKVKDLINSLGVGFMLIVLLMGTLEGAYKFYGILVGGFTYLGALLYRYKKLRYLILGFCLLFLMISYGGWTISSYYIL